MSVKKNKYTIAEAAELKGRNPQFIREQIKAGKIPGCTAFKKGTKNWIYDIPKQAFDNHLRGVSQTEMESLRVVVREEVAAAISNFFNNFINTEVERRLAEK